MKGQGIYGTPLHLSLQTNVPFITKKHTKAQLRFKAQTCCAQAQVRPRQAAGSKPYDHLRQTGGILALNIPSYCDTGMCASFWCHCYQASKYICES